MSAKEEIRRTILHIFRRHGVDNWTHDHLQGVLSLLDNIDDRAGAMIRLMQLRRSGCLQNKVVMPILNPDTSFSQDYWDGAVASCDYFLDNLGAEFPTDQFQIPGWDFWE